MGILSSIAKKGATLILIVLFLLPSVIAANEKVVIYYNKACGGCTEYLTEHLIPMLKERGISSIEMKDYVNKKENRAELNEMNEKIGFPPKLQGHFAIFIGEKVILEGHVPHEIIDYLLNEENQKGFDKIVVFQDEMENARSYKVWAFKGEVKEYPIDTPITEYLTWFKENKDKLKTPDDLKTGLNPKTFIPLLLITGLFDGINPCAFAVLLFFIAFLYTIHRTKTHILKVGIIYIMMIYLTYLGIGLGILKAFMVIGVHHLMGKIASWLVIFLGLINIKDYFWYGKWINISMPKASKELINKWVHKATIPATIVTGFLVGLCVFPCSGGPYVAILGLMAAKTTYFMGFLYLLLYNVMFVMPLIIILLFFSNRRVIGKISRWEAEEKKTIKLVIGILMVLLGVIILIFFV